jgi:hypothetical protein
MGGDEAATFAGGSRYLFDEVGRKFDRARNYAAGINASFNASFDVNLIASYDDVDGQLSVGGSSISIVNVAGSFERRTVST